MTIDHLKIKNLSVAVLVSVIAVAVLYSIFWGPAKRFADSLQPARAFVVTGEEKAFIAPDIVRISFSVVSEEKTAEAAVADNNKKMNTAIAFVKNQGIDPADIKTTQYSLSPRYEYDKRSQRSFISGYTLTQTASVKIKIAESMGQVTKIMGGLPEVGVNQIGGLSFEVDDSEAHLVEARAKAFDKARQKAESMARANGVRLGRIVTISDNRGVTPYYRDFSYAKEMALGSAAAAPTLEPGTQEIPVQVSVTYEFK